MVSLHFKKERAFSVACAQCLLVLIPIIPQQHQVLSFNVEQTGIVKTSHEVAYSATHGLPDDQQLKVLDALQVHAVAPEGVGKADA